MKLSIHPTVLFRTPKFPVHAALKDCWDELKAAIAISSSAFYETIKDVSAEELDGLDSKVSFTIWKYFNRAKYRATPYGTFASFGLIENTFSNAESEVRIKKEQIEHTFADWPYKNDIVFDFSKAIANNSVLFSNTSFYYVGDNIRYISCANGMFELSEIGFHEQVDQILKVCSSPIPIASLIEILEIPNDELEDLYALLTDMHELQMLFTESDPNIIGEDYFTRIGAAQTSFNNKYYISERSFLSGQINQKLLQHIPALISIMHGFLPKAERKGLKTFADKFTSKFEQQEVPLLVALDPELGVGYENLEQAGSGGDFVQQFIEKQPKKNQLDLKSILKDHLNHASFKRDETIHLNKLPLNFQPTEVALPNTFNMLMSVIDDCIKIESIGGATANSLMGRFSLASQAVEQYCKENARFESDANPDVFFFDVAYMVENSVDNVNRRKNIYAHQLSILNLDTSENPLSFEDILVSVVNGRIVLRSKKLNKRLVPRMASAYNYTRSDLSVFRLLCDLQHQELQTALSFSLDTVFEDLDYYPRLQFHNIILNFQKWKIRKVDFLAPKSKELELEMCMQKLNEIGVSQYFKTGNGDQTLCFNQKSEWDMRCFLEFLSKKGEMLLEEVVMPEKSLVIDEHDAQYLSQFILNLNHNQQIFKAARKDENTISVKRSFLPGSEWIYFEIFCHQHRADQILIERIALFLQEETPHIEKWFFIRYNENGNHLRFRILVKDLSVVQKLTQSLLKNLSGNIEKGLISDIQIRTYKREIERYGADLIEFLEGHFSYDSNFVLTLLQTGANDFQKYSICRVLVLQIIKSKIFQVDSLIKLIGKISDNFNKEHHLEPADFKKLNIEYVEFAKFEDLILNEDQRKAIVPFFQSFYQALQMCSEDRRSRLFGDLIHMHINRLFNSNQRTHEMIIYYFIFKDLQRKKATGLLTV
ncbi:thiopeptide-type bacteriocin biosynthesis protein [Pedobacter sp. AW1-32]|uniref:thiopeptide-type bacteriocin biosynthesis protein n=1 Tax=Pedobacter sp. AW1-32 TaxID=3383026 RepID=UPI003FF04BA9